METRWIICIHCKKRFYVKNDLLFSKLPLHCPFCDLYFCVDTEKEMIKDRPTASEQGEDNQSGR